MSNNETTEIKKKISISGIVSIVMVAIEFVLLGSLTYLKAVDSDMFLFGRAFDKSFLSTFFLIPSMVCTMNIWVSRSPGRQRTVWIIFCSIFIVACTVFLIHLIYDDIKNNADTEAITLSDGNEILLSERITHSTISGRELTYMDVYQINGFAAKKVGEINETYFSNKCLLQDKYTYEYDEAGKKLTIICEYGTYGDGTIRFKEEYDTGFWEEEFVLE